MYQYAEHRHNTVTLYGSGGGNDDDDHADDYDGDIDDIKHVMRKVTSNYFLFLKQ